MSLPSGTHVGPYEIVTAIGAGGMGEVYRARDSRLDRDVAVKVLPEHLSHDPQSLARFEREAKAVAALSHPNILAIFDVGTQAGASYAVTELLEGETLRARLAEGAMAWRKAAEIGAAIAEGLAAAHSKGITHRDLKPENIFIIADGRVKILDFGLARFESAGWNDEGATQGVTREGAVMGTVGYMSPEQVRGNVAGPSSDIFSFGCVLHEMVSGRRAFGGPTPAETLTAILRDSPTELSHSGIQVPIEMERLISHCLEKHPEERFQSARDLAFHLKAMLTGSSSGTAAVPAEPDKGIHSIAVLPFSNASHEPDAEFFSDGITESIINSLTQIAQLRVTPRSSVFRYKGKDHDPQAVGRELNVRVVLTGRVIQRGETLVVGTELTDVIEGSQLWGERYNRKVCDIFELEEEIARKISEGLRMKLTGEENKRLTKRCTENSEAYQLYLKGRHYWNKRTPEGMTKGIAYFQQAIDKDPGYALAYAGVADCLSILSTFGVVPAREGWAKAKVAAAAAIALDADLAESHTSQAFIRGFGDWDWASAEQECRRAIELNCSTWMAPYAYAMLLAVCGRHDEAERQIARAQELEPLSPVVVHVAAVNALTGRRYAEAIERCMKGLEIDPNYSLTTLWLGLAYEQTGRYEEAIATLERAVRLFGGTTLAIGAVAHAHAAAGNQFEARRLLQELLASAEGKQINAYDVALVHAGLGEREQALDWLEKACDAHSGWLTFLCKGDPRLDGLRAEARFEGVLRRMGLG